jgi:LmbE family N-acetylglucosaminyl deacetylase
MPDSRRNFIRNASVLLPGLSLSTIAARPELLSDKKLKIVCIGGHPDDPESGCGGTLSKFANAGHRVTIIYLTRGEAGIPGVSHENAAKIRTSEAEAACKIIKAESVFAGQTDGDTIVNSEWISKIRKLVEAQNPDIVFTHWPVDSHKDHQAASLMTIQAWILGNKKFDLYFFEVCLGDQTHIFHPTDYVDITDTREQKKKAVYCHTSQNPAEIYEADDCNHKLMEEFRGMEINVQAAEGFVKCGGLKFTM